MDEGKSSKTEEKIWTVPFAVLLLTNFLSMLGGAMTATTMPVYLSSLDLDVSVVGMVVGTLSVSAILVRPFAGPAFDAFPRKRLLMCCQLINALSLFGYSVVSDVNVLFCLRLFHGIGFGCQGPLSISLVNDFIPKSRLSQGIGTYATSSSAAMVAGPATGIFLMNAIGFTLTYRLSALLLCCAMLSISTIKEPSRELLPYKVRFDRCFCKETLDKAFVGALFSTAFSAINAYLVLMSHEYGIENVGFFFATYALAVMFVAPRYGKFADKYGAERVLIFGSIWFMLSYVLLHFAHTVPLLVLTALVASMGFGSCSPQIQSLAMKSVDRSRASVVNNTHYTGIDLGMLLGPVVGGFVVEALIPYSATMGEAYSNMWFVMIIPVFIGFLIILRWNAKRNK